MLQTSISILQLLVQRFWFKSNLGLLAKRQCHSLCSARVVWCTTLSIVLSNTHSAFVCVHISFRHL